MIYSSRDHVSNLFVTISSAYCTKIGGEYGVDEQSPNVNRRSEFVE